MNTQKGAYSTALSADWSLSPSWLLEVVPCAPAKAHAPDSSVWDLPRLIKEAEGTHLRSFSWTCMKLAEASSAGLHAGAASSSVE